MIASRTRAVVLLLAAFVGGCALGALATKALGKGSPRRFNPQGQWGRPQPQDWMRALGLDSVTIDSIGAMRRRNSQVIDSVTKSRIGPQIDSLEAIISPALDSLYGSIRPALDSVRTQSRAATRAALPESFRPRYDSVVAAADSARRRSLEQRKRNQGRGGPDGGGPGRGGPARGGEGPPGSSHGF